MSQVRSASCFASRWPGANGEAALRPAPTVWARRALIAGLAMVGALGGARGIGASGIPSGPAGASEERPAPADPGRYREKSAVVLELARFIDWPQALNDPESPFVIGVLGDEGWSAALRREAAGQRMEGQEIRIRSFRNLDEVDPCAVLVVGPEKARLLATILDFLAGWNGVLTVGDSADFTMRGGVVRLVERPGRIAFELNRDAARRAGLRLGAQVLRLAERVLPEPAAEPAP